MIWAVILLGKIALCLAEPKSFVYVSEIEDDDYPPPIDFKYYDRQRYIPPYIRKYSVGSSSGVNPGASNANDGFGKNVKATLSSKQLFDPSSSPRTDNTPPSTHTKAENPSLPAYNARASSPNRPGRHSSSSFLKPNPAQNNGPISYITFNPPGSTSSVNSGSGFVPRQSKANQDVSSQGDFQDNPSQKPRFTNPRSGLSYSNGGNTGVLPPQSVIRNGPASLPGAGNTDGARSSAFVYSGPQGSNNFQPPLRDFDLLPNVGTFPDSKKAIGNTLNDRNQPSETDDSPNRVISITPTDVINRLPGCPFPGKHERDPSTSNYQNPSSRPNSSIRRSITFGRGDAIGVVLTTINRQAASYAGSSSFAGERNTSEQYQSQSQFPTGNINSNRRIKPILTNYQYSRLGNPSDSNRRSRHNNIPQTFNNPSQGSQIRSNQNGQRPQVQEANTDSNVGNGETGGNKNNRDRNHAVVHFNNNANDQSATSRIGGPTKPENSGISQRNTNAGSFNDNRQRQGNAPTGRTRNTQSFNNNLQANNKPAISTSEGNSAHQSSQNSAGNTKHQSTEYTMYRPGSYQTMRLPQPHEKYPAVGIKEYFGPAHLAIAPLPADVDGDQIPGEAWVDYPLYHVIPTTSFSCGNQPLNGYYADMESSCQVYHFCQPGGVQASFLCPNGTIFSQKKFACQWWYKTDCTNSPHYFSLNSNLYKIPEKAEAKQ